MKRALRFLRRVIAVLVLAVIFIVNARLYTQSGTTISVHTPIEADVRAQLKFLRRAIESGADADMQRLFPEGRFLMNCLYGLANVEAGLREQENSPLRQHFLDEARWAMLRVDSPTNKAVFSQQLHPQYGIFYAGWSATLHAGTLALQSEKARETQEVDTLRARCDEIAAAFTAAQTPYLQAYHGEAWTCDSAAAIFALYACDRILTPSYNSTIERWITAARSLRDPATGLLGHRVHTETGALLDGPRATSMCITIRFLSEASPDLGAELYENFREQMMTTRFGLPGVREYPKGVNGSGDVDSGPLLFGISTSATAVTAGVARIVGDADAAARITQATKTLAMPFTWNGERRHFGGMLPVADAFITWSHTARPWFSKSQPHTWNPVFPWWWRIPTHLISLVIVIPFTRPLLKRNKETSNDSPHRADTDSANAL